MNYFFIPTCLILLNCSSASINRPHFSTDLKGSLKGEWVYQFSLIDGEELQLAYEIHLPTYKIKFEECDDERELTMMPSTVVNMRQTNALRNLRSQAYNEKGNIIDTYYPMARVVGDSSTVIIYNYGLKYKSEYIIDRLEKDTLVVHNNKVFEIGDKRVSQVLHSYVRVR